MCFSLKTVYSGKSMRQNKIYCERNFTAEATIITYLKTANPITVFKSYCLLIVIIFRHILNYLDRKEPSFHLLIMFKNFLSSFLNFFFLVKHFSNKRKIIYDYKSNLKESDRAIQITIIRINNKIIRFYKSMIFKWSQDRLNLRFHKKYK